MPHFAQLLATDWSSVFTAVSALAAAIAALAAWATVYTEHRARAREREPLLSIGVSEMLGTPRRERITVENGGGGVAREVTFLVVSGGSACMGGLPPTGTLGPGKRVVLDAGYTPTDGRVMAAVMCRFGPYLMAWDAAGRHERQHLDRTSGISHQDMFWRFYPAAPTVERLEISMYDYVPGLSSP